MRLLLIFTQLLIILLYNSYSVQSEDNVKNNVLFIVDQTISMIDFKTSVTQTINNIVNVIIPSSLSLIVVNDPGMRLFALIKHNIRF